jgi:hypothetical protein
VDSRGEKKPRLAVSIADMALKLKLLPSVREGDENAEDANDISKSDLFRLVTMAVSNRCRFNVK